MWLTGEPDCSKSLHQVKSLHSFSAYTVLKTTIRELDYTVTPENAQYDFSGALP